MQATLLVARVSLFETEFRNDPRVPDHRPPGAALRTVHDGIERIHIYLSPRPPGEVV